MSHYIIDSQKLQKYQLLILALVCISFGLGYLSGFLHGTDKMALGGSSDFSLLNSLAAKPAIKLAEPENRDNSGVSLPDIDSAGATQEKTPENATQTEEPKLNPDLKPELGSEQKKGADENNPEMAPNPSSNQSPDLSPDLSKATINQSGKKVEPLSVSKVSTPATSPERDNSNQYLIQVGLFANKENASDFVEELRQSDFKAFFEGFIASNGQEKYNVRLGPFTDKSTAQMEMSSFQKQHNISVYILNRK